jgi:hypothetical protein
VSANGLKGNRHVSLKPLLTWGLAVVVLGAVMFAGARDAVAQTFSPTLTVTLADPTPDSPSNFETEFGIGDTDVNFAAVVAFIPPEWGIVPGDQMPIGTDVGFLDAASTLGLFNSPCNQALPVHFDFKNSSIDITDTVSFNDTDESDADTTADYAKDADNNGLYDAIDKYPDFLNRLFDNQQPIRRSAGITIVAGIPVLLQFLIFPPGTLVDEDLPNDPERGFPSVTVLQNAGDPDIVPQPSAITDFCSPLGTVNTTLGVTCDPAAELPPDYTGECLEDYNPEPGTPLFVNPLDGDYTFSTISFGQRDADGDGFENGLDTCALLSNVGSPKVSLDGDLDGDGLDGACDPNDTSGVGTDSDQDADGYQNRQDNCPLDANGEADGETNQADEDVDQIGDVCDPEPDVENGDLTPSDLSSEVTVGAGGEGAKASCAQDGGADGVICWFEGYEPDGGSNQPTDPPDGETDEPTSPGQSPDETETDGSSEDDDDGGSSTGIIIAVVAVAAIAIIGGGAFMLMRRNNSA